MLRPVPFLALLACSLILPVFTLRCPFGMKLSNIKGVDRCIFSEEELTWSYLREECNRPTSLAELRQAAALGLLSSDVKYWTSAVSLFGNGAVVEWDGGPRNGRPVFTPSLWGDRQNTGSKYTCVAYHAGNDTFTTELCTDHNRIVCILDPYSSVLESGPCKEGFWYVHSPVPVCITKKLSFKGNVRQAVELCKTRGGYVLERAKVHIGHPFLNQQYSADDEVLLGSHEEVEEYKTIYIMKNQTVYKEDYSKDRIFDHIYCEHDVPVKNDNITYKIDDLNKKNYFVYKNDLSSIRDTKCFTTSETYYPTEAQITLLNDTFFFLERQQDGIYWCTFQGRNFQLYHDDNDSKSLWSPTKQLRTCIYLTEYKWQPEDNNLSYDDIQQKIERYWDDSINDLFEGNKAPKYKLEIVFSAGHMFVLFSGIDFTELKRNPNNNVTVYDVQDDSATYSLIYGSRRGFIESW